MDDYYKKYETYCQYFPEFNFKSGKDEIYFYLLHTEYPELNIYEEFKVFHIWILGINNPPPHLKLAFRSCLLRKRNKKET